MHIKAKALKLFYQYIERLGETRVWGILTLDDRFIYSAAAHHVIRLDGKQFLEDVPVLRV